MKREEVEALEYQALNLLIAREVMGFIRRLGAPWLGFSYTTRWVWAHPDDPMVWGEEADPEIHKEAAPEDHLIPLASGNLGYALQVLEEVTKEWGTWTIYPDRLELVTQSLEVCESHDGTTQGMARAACFAAMEVRGLFERAGESAEMAAPS